MRELVGTISDNEEIWFMDETTCNLWQNMRKVWRPIDRPFHILLPDDRGTSITIIGAIGWKSQRLVYSIQDRTNAVNV